MTLSMGEPQPDAQSADRAQAWRRAGLSFALATILLFILQFEIVSGMVETWMSSDTYGYGFIIVPLVVFLFYRRRHHLAALTPRPGYWALLWISGALILHLVAAVANVTVVQQLAFVAVWQGLFVLFMGWAVARQAIFALFYLYFAVPMGAEIVPTLQMITAEITVPLLRASGIPTFHDGIFIQIPAGNFIVADICSGARFLITSIVLGALAAHLFYRSWLRRGLFMLICLVVPILANGLRAYGIILLAHLSDSRIALEVDHVVYGLVFLSLVLFIVIGLGALFREHDAESAPPTPTSSGARSGLSATVVPLLLAIGLVGGGDTWAQRVTAPPDIAASVALQAPDGAGDWRPATTALAGWSPDFPGADTHLLQAYQAAESTVALYIGHYLYQRDGHEIISVANSVVGDDPGTQVMRFQRTAADLASGRLSVHETLAQTADGPRLIWSWYEIGGSRVVSPVPGKLFEVWHTLSGGSRAATAFAVATGMDDDPRSARATLTRFLNALTTNQSLAVTLAKTDKASAAD